MKNGAESTPTRLNLSVDQAAAALGVSPRTVRKLITSRELKSHRIGRRVLVSVQAATEFVRHREAETAE